MDNIEPSPPPLDGHMPKMAELKDDCFNKDKKKGWKRKKSQLLNPLSFGFLRKLTEIVWAREEAERKAWLEKCEHQ